MASTAINSDQALHWFSGVWVAGRDRTSRNDVISPLNGQKIGEVACGGKLDVEAAVASARQNLDAWMATPLKERADVLLQFRHALVRNSPQISAMISAESGKLPAEAEAGLRKGIEVVDFAISLQNLEHGGRLEVSRGVFCESRRLPLGVVAGITPFNFPAMVPLWMMPIAIALGNAFIWKPSEKTPLTSRLLAECFSEAGLPAGILTIIQGDRSTVEAICDHKDISAIGFVGSSPVAQAVYARATANGKRALCLGGAKNHIILMPDADPELAANGILASFTGCAGQRCMAGSVLVAVDDAEKRTQKIIELLLLKARQIKVGSEIGAIINKESLQRLHGAIASALSAGALALLDGRSVQAPKLGSAGNWLGPTILDQVKVGSAAACDELFGPVLSIVRAKNLSEALAIEAASRFGNACSVFTQSGAIAEEVAKRTRVGMVGINVGVPVPREPFSFGGTGYSKFGQGDITGPAALDLWTNLKKITTKWQPQTDQSWMS